MKPMTDRDRALQAEARVAELEAELMEWRRWGQDGESLELARCAKLIGAGGQAARLVLALLAASMSGRILSEAQLIDIIIERDSEAESPSRVLLSQIVKARRRLEAVGFAGAIQNVHGCGYYIAPTTARALRAAIDAVAL